MPTFPEVRVGEPIAHGALTVFPLYAECAVSVEYVLADEAVAGGSVTVTEVGEAGSVPDLLVENGAEAPVLFLEGEELRGAKQNRVLNTTVLVAAKSRTTIPVSCVERGRWRYTAKHFASGGSHASHKLRHVLKKSVERSAKQGHGHRSDQGQVWQEVGRQQASLGSHSPTGAMADTYTGHQAQLTEYRERLKYVEGAAGLAVAVGGKVVSVDLFDKPPTCRKVWDRLLTGLVMDALEAPPEGEKPAAAAVTETLTALRDAPWQQTPPAGAGEEFRAELAGDRHASALTCEGTVLHGSLVVAG
jgi:hypothetical protein